MKENDFDFVKEINALAVKHVNQYPKERKMKFLQDNTFLDNKFIIKALEKSDGDMLQAIRNIKEMEKDVDDILDKLSEIGGENERN